MTEQQNQQDQQAQAPAEEPREAAPADRPTDGGGSAPAAPAEPAASTPVPRPTPATIPSPASIPSPAALSKAAPAANPSPAVSEVEPIGDPQDIAEAEKFGRVDAEGTVSVIEAAGERVVGQYPDVPEKEALSLYVRRFLDIKAQVLLFETRLSTLSARDLDTGLASLEEAVAEPAAVGDLDSLRARVTDLRGRVAQRKEELVKEREAAKAQALDKRTRIVERAEAIAGADPATMQWRQQGDRLRSLLDEWKNAQRTGARIDKPTEDALWKRFSAARSTFDRGRRQFFAELDRKHAEAKTAKEKLIERAEALQNSTDWGPTSAAYRQLMDEWKAAGRASRKDDDALWARFRAAQDVFFQARQAQNEALDAEYEGNLKVKLGLLEEAEKLVPVKDLEASKSALRDIQDRWEEAGKVPRAQVRSVEGRLRAVEQTIRDAEQAEWKRTNPQLQERAEGAAAQLQAAISSLEDDLAKARAGGDEKKIKAAQDALDARKAWLEQVLKAAQDAS